MLSDLGPHLIDQALQLFGMPEAVSADIVAQRPGAVVDDYFDLTLHYGRRRVRLCCSTLIAAPRPRFAIHGTQGSYVKHGLDPQEAQLKAGTRSRRSVVRHRLSGRDLRRSDRRSRVGADEERQLPCLLRGSRGCRSSTARRPPVHREGSARRAGADRPRSPGRDAGIGAAGPGRQFAGSVSPAQSHRRAAPQCRATKRPASALYVPGATRHVCEASSKTASKRGSTVTHYLTTCPGAKSTFVYPPRRFGASQPPAAGET